MLNKIAEETKQKLDSVKNCLQNLLYHKLIVMIDIFQFSNIYKNTK
jgi:hypothetical protein